MSKTGTTVEKLHLKIQGTPMDAMILVDDEPVGSVCMDTKSMEFVGTDNGREVARGTDRNAVISAVLDSWCTCTGTDRDAIGW